jgi:hypothetical protein
MAVVTNPTALTDVAVHSGISGPTMNEQNLDVTNGNKQAWHPGMKMHFRNTTVGAIVINFYCDQLGTEVLILALTVPGSATQNGLKLTGEFPSRMCDHSASVATALGSIVFKQASGSSGDIKACAIPHNPSLAGSA